MRLPTYDELASEDEQLEVLEYPLDGSLFVVGPPGSGKTVLAVQRADMVSERSRSASVLIVTYNRMLRRLLHLLNKGRVDSRTMHSFVWGGLHSANRKIRANRPKRQLFLSVV